MEQQEQPIILLETVELICLQYLEILKYPPCVEHLLVNIVSLSSANNIISKNNPTYWWNSIIVYFDTTDECHDLTFSFGQNAQGATKESNRRFSVKVCMMLNANCKYNFKFRSVVIITSLDRTKIRYNFSFNW